MGFLGECGRRTIASEREVRDHSLPSWGVFRRGAGHEPALTAIIGIETLAPHGKWIGRLAGAGMVLWGLTLLTGF